MSAPQPDDVPLRPRPEEAIEFLKKFRGEGPWVLTALRPDRKKGAKNEETVTIPATDPDAVTAFIEEWNRREHWNVYFTVNSCGGREMTTKPKREHIAAMEWLHVDVDPRAGEDLDEEQTRILALLRNPPEGVPAPTCITFSGGGYQGFWKLKDRKLLDATADTWEDAKLYNKRLEQILDGDKCHNVDRIMRVPGSINWPDERKRKKGRVPALAAVMAWSDPEHAYDLDEFEKAEADVRASGPVGSFEPPAEVPRFASVDDIPELRDAPQCRVVIVQGTDPDDPNKFGDSRSEWLFFGVCEMVRQGMSDEAIYSVITDPTFGISASVLDKGSGIERYALRQIRRARERAIDPMLMELNDRHAVIESIGGKCRITSWERTDLGENSREILQLQLQSDFLLRYRNRTMDFTTGQGKVASKPAGIWWLEHPARRQYRGVIFDPSIEGDAEGYLNLWRGFKVPDREGKYPLFRELIEEVLASGDPETASYIWRWTAWLVQNPHLPAEVALVFRGLPGTGKGTFVRALGRLFGQHFMHVSSSQHVSGQFNAHMRDCVLFFADEAFLGGSKDAIGTLKRVITEPTLFIEGKGVDAVQWPNRLHVIIASNEDWVVPVGPDERRFVVLDVSPTRREDHAWFAALEREMAEGGLSALLHDLLRVDLDGWHPRQDRPATAALTDQKVASLRGLDAFWFECLRSGELPAGREEEDGAWVASSALLDAANATVRPRRPFTGNQLKSLLSDPQGNHGGRGMGFEQRRDQPGKGGRGYEIPALDEARARWDERRFPYPWDEADGWAVDGFDTETYREWT